MSEGLRWFLTGIAIGTSFMSLCLVFASYLRVRAEEKRQKAMGKVMKNIIDQLDQQLHSIKLQNTHESLPKA